MDKKKIGTKLKELRGDKTMREVAAAVGISTSALGMYETGQRVPNDNIKIALANFFGTTVDSIFFATELHVLCSSKQIAHTSGEEG